MSDDNLRTSVSPTEADNTASNPFYHVLSDGTNPLSVTGGILDVNATVQLDTAYTDDAAFVVGTDEVNAQGFLFDDTARYSGRRRYWSGPYDVRSYAIKCNC